MERRYEVIVVMVWPMCVGTCVGTCVRRNNEDTGEDISAEEEEETMRTNE